MSGLSIMSATSLPPDPEVRNTACFGGRPRHRGNATVTNWSRSTCVGLSRVDWYHLPVAAIVDVKRFGSCCDDLEQVLVQSLEQGLVCVATYKHKLAFLERWWDGCRGCGVMWHRYRVELADFRVELAQKSCRRRCVRGCADEIARYNKWCTINQLCRWGV